jgi:hypothetical protein
MRSFQTVTRTALRCLPALALAALCAILPGCDDDVDGKTTWAVMRMMWEADDVAEQATGLSLDQLLDDLARDAADGDPPRQRVVTAAEVEALERRLGAPVPPELRELLARPAALPALDWLEPAAMVRAGELGVPALAAAFEVTAADWPTSTLTIEPIDGWFRRLPAADLERYLVLARNELFDTLLLYDPREPPALACCRIIETSLLSDEAPTGYASLRRWLEGEWTGNRLGRHLEAAWAEEPVEERDAPVATE